MAVAAIKTTEITNWAITKPCIKEESRKPLAVVLLFSTSMGKNDDKKNAGYKPASSPIGTLSTNKPAKINKSLPKCRLNFSPDKSLKKGKSNSTSGIASIKANNVIRIDSFA